MASRFSALIWSRPIASLHGVFACAALLAVMAGCSSAPPQSSTPVASAPTAQGSPSPAASPTAAPQSVPQPTPEAPKPEPESGNSDKPGMLKTTRTIEKCVIRMAKVNDPESLLNVRSTPNTTSKENIVGQLPNGSFVDVEQEQDGWFKITGEKPGWIAKSRTQNNCGEKIERVGLGQDATEIRDRFIGVGSHKYVLSLTKGQKLSVTNLGKVFPDIVDPNGKSLMDYRGREEKKSWSGEVSATGDYAIIFESNYKGYEYAVSVEAL